MKRHSKGDPCPICGGWPDLPRGKGARCAGWISADGWAHCSREELAGNAKFHSGSVTYSHKLAGRCPCGETHGEAPPRDPPHRARAEVHQIGEAAGARIVATYDYRARDGTLLYQVVRKEPKTFLQRRPCPDHRGNDNARDGRCVTPECRSGWIWNMKGQPTTLYRVPELFQALEAGDPVWICEGEKDADALWEAGVVATCNTGGAGKWRPELATPFARMTESEVVIVRDRDEAGVAHARAVLDSVSAAVGPGVRCRVVEAKTGKDAADHLGAGLGLGDFRQVWPPSADLLETDPAEFKRYMIRQALEAPTSALERILTEGYQAESQPLFPLGVVGEPKLIRHLQGAVVLSGAPSAGKSYLAIATAVDANLAGWDVFYLSCEMHETLVFSRAARAFASAGLDPVRALDQVARGYVVERAKTLVLPESFHYVDVKIGVRLQDVLEHLVRHVSARPALVVFDSISSFVDNMAEGGNRGDTFGMKDLREAAKWIVAARKLTHGNIAFLLLSELNKEGRAKGRFLDHRCDYALALESEQDSADVKSLRLTKSWWSPIGPVGSFVVDWELGRLRVVQGLRD
jgi:hypothetical protein